MATSRFSNHSGIALVMPEPTTLRAGAVWITAANWADAAIERWGHAWVLVPGAMLSPSQARGLTGSFARTRSNGRSPRFLTLRTAVKDARLSVCRTTASATYPTEQLRSNRISFVWQHHDLFLRVGSSLARARGIPLVQFVDAPIVWEARRWGVRRPAWGSLLERWGEKPQLLEADLVACVSEEVAQVVMRFGVAPERVVVTPCAADERLFSPAIDGRSVRRRLGFRRSDFVIGWTGSFRSFHGLDRLIHAFSIVAASSPQARLLLVGDGARRSEIEGDLERRGVRSRAVLTGQVPHDEVPSHVRAMDVAVVTAADDRFHYSPIKLREYLSCAVPVVAPAVGQIVTTLQDDKDAILYPARDTERLVSALTRLARDPTLRTRIGDAGFEGERGRGGTAAQLDAVLERLGNLIPTGVV